jgi:hypothetical protein
MKLGIIIAVITGAVILAAGVGALLTLGFRSSSIPSTATISIPVPSITTAFPAISVTPMISSSGTATSATTITDVSFGLEIISVTGADLSRTITAQLTNTGTTDAHNVLARADVTSQGSTIKINGQDFISQGFGTLNAGATINIVYTLSVSVFDGLKIIRNGALVTLTVSSDEKTQTVSYNYQP